MLTTTMDSTLIFLLLAVVAFAAAFYYLYIVKGWYDWAHRGRASIVVLMGLLVPVLAVTLWQQHEARGQLAAHDIAIHPELGSSVGIGTGSIAGGTHWAFRFNGGRRALLDYYRQPRHRPGWVIAEDNDVFLILRRDKQRLMISASESTAIFQLSRVSSQTS